MRRNFRIEIAHPDMPAPEYDTVDVLDSDQGVTVLGFFRSLELYITVIQVDFLDDRLQSIRITEFPDNFRSKGITHLIRRVSSDRSIELILSRSLDKVTVGCTGLAEIHVCTAEFAE